MNPAAVLRPSALRRPPALRAEQLGMLTQQLHTQAGIRVDSTRDVIGSCIVERMDYLGLQEVDDYLATLDDSINARAEWLALIDLLTVNETRFFRQSEAFDCLKGYVNTLMASGPAPKEFSFWSAGCSYGHELYSMAMVVESVISQCKPWLEWHGIGTDISFKAINRAQQAVYEESSLTSVPSAYSNVYLEQKLGGRMKVVEDIRSRTHFFHSNLLHLDSAPFADFNAVFCQNVLIYFPRDRQRWIIDQLVTRLRVGGLLILGAGEDAGWINNRVRRRECPGVCAYEKIGD